MRRADRLFQIIQVLRRDRIRTAAALGSELGVSERTIYRDIQDLVASGVPIESEAGVGYRIPPRFDLPPITFTIDELEALLVGARIAQAWGDPGLAEAARSALRKVEAVAPPQIRAGLAGSEIHAPDFPGPSTWAHHMGVLRSAMRKRTKVRLRYRRADGTESDRIVHPLGLYFWGYTWSLAAWCELRAAFRTMRIDRIVTVEPLEDRFQIQEGHSLDDYLKHMGEVARAWEESQGSCQNGGRSDCQA